MTLVETYSAMVNRVEAGIRNAGLIAAPYSERIRVLEFEVDQANRMSLPDTVRLAISTLEHAWFQCIARAQRTRRTA